jgi:hypothetical protein
MAVGDVESTERGSGARFNDGKVPLDLIPLSALIECARVFDYGRKKYAAWNWAKGMDWSVPYGCLLRHMAAWFDGEDSDPESGLPHLGHAMCNLVMLSTFARTFREGDDRPIRWMYADPAKALDMVGMDIPLGLYPLSAAEIAMLDGFPITGGGQSSNSALHDTRTAPPLDPATEALIERAELAEDATDDLKAGEAYSAEHSPQAYASATAAMTEQGD